MVFYHEIFSRKVLTLGAPVQSGGGDVTRVVPTIIVDERILLRQGVASLLSETPYKVIASVAAVSEIRGLILPRERPLLTVLGLPNGADTVLQMADEVHRIIPDSKLLAIGECIGDLDIGEIQNSGLDGIAFDVGSREALLKVFDLALLGQQLVIMKRPGQTAPPRATGPALSPCNGSAPPTTRARTENG